MTDLIYLYASLGIVLTLTTCYGFICHYIDLKTYNQFEERDDIECEFMENEDMRRNNDDFIP